MRVEATSSVLDAEGATGVRHHRCMNFVASSAREAALSPAAHALDVVAIEEALRDHARLQEIAELELVSPEVDAILQEATRAAAEHFALPVGLVSVVLDEAQHFAAMYGLAGELAAQRGTPIEWSFCRYAVATREAFVVEDATANALVHDNPLVTSGAIRCYAGIPLVSARGHVLGSFCVIGPDERAFSEDELDELRRRAAAVVARIEARAAARATRAA